MTAKYSCSSSTKKIAYLFNKTKIAMAFALSAASFSIHAATGDELFISEAQEIFIQQTASSQSGDLADSNALRMSFAAYGKMFRMELWENKNLVSGGAGGDTVFYEGVLENAENSWVRLNIINGLTSGAIYDGEQLFLIDVSSKISESVSALDASDMADTSSSETSAIFRAADITNSQTCDTQSSDAAFSYSRLASELSDARDVVAEAAGANKQIKVNVVTDAEYTNASNDARAEALGHMNVVDGIFSAQVGVEIAVNNLNTLNNNGNLVSTSASQLLGQFRNFTGNNNPGLAHLLTGKEIQGSTIGIAFVGAICTQSGVGLSQRARNGGVVTALTVAHEIGHNFGAPHDNQNGSACAREPGSFLMNPSINGSRTFSQCSLNQMAPYVAQRRCLTNIDTTPPTPPTPVEPISCNFNASFNNGIAADNFEFVADAQSPQYTRISNSVAGSAGVVVGGLDNNDITNMEAAFKANCLADNAGSATFTVTSLMSQSSEYEADENSQIAIRVNGQEEVFETLVGDGNGGNTQTTGELVRTVTLPINAGSNSVELVCRNNKKTFANEETTCSFDSITSVIDNDNGGGGGNDTPILDASFENSADGFTYVDDPETPAFTQGVLIASGGVGNSGAVRIDVGGVNNDDILDMEASISFVFDSQAEQRVLRLQANLIQSSEYETDEFSELAISIDGERRVLATITGDNNGGDTQSTGFQSYEIPLNLSAGSHTLLLSCANNKKTFANELTSCIFDNVSIK